MEKLFSKVVPNKAINEEIQAGVENASKMRDMCEANDPFSRKKRVWTCVLVKQFVAMHNTLDM